MANTDIPLGLRPVVHKYGTTPKIRHYTAKDSEAIYEGEPLILNTTGHATAYTTTGAVAGNVIGVAAAPMTAVATDRSLPVYDDPEQVFEIQADAAGTQIAALKNYLFRCFRFLNPSSGNTTTLQSKCEIDSSSEALTVGDAATNIAPVICVGVSLETENTALSANAKYLVKFAPPVHLQGIGEVGIGTATGATTPFSGRENS